MKILFFARLRDSIDCAETSLEVLQPTQVHNVIKQLLIDHPDWQDAFDKPLLVAINQTMADMDSQVNNEDELAFFPPVTGG
ncbi:MoaD/ThiS family protein [Gynuella sunshinyii]|uniref:Molybdopterin synthase sulfur carrier subunit n=1 Tax=Gynuella sunshinyii YC6258 TaxID=1445510 RepID=A0A0C5V221_9GAMM|nr:MoaD/ThiS family protein [Gynuella sunshinyii]AJQ93590.1 molybdopterin converting factor, small subunit [Gynuella sunshinyii YC6258]